MTETQNKRLALFDIDEVLLDSVTSMRACFEDLRGDPITNQNLAWHMQHFEVDPSYYSDFGKHLHQRDDADNLPPKPGMKEVLLKLKELSFDIVLITAAPSNEESKRNRRHNVTLHFGDIFKDIRCTDFKPKTEYIKEYATAYDYSFFCDDSPKHIARSIGLVTDSIWMYNEPLSVFSHKFPRDKVKIARTPLDILDIAIAGTHGQSDAGKAGSPD